MYSKTPLNSMNKRPREESELQTPRKSQFGVVKVGNDLYGEGKQFMFRILMPNSSTLELKMCELRNVIPIEDFICSVRKVHFNAVKQGAQELQKKINWNYPDLHFTDTNSNKISIKLNLSNFKHDTWHFLWLHDGSPEPDTYEEMWDLTPDTELLKELPDDYTFETALADLIDNSLQAVWSNDSVTNKLISVELSADRIAIFDSGPGMDGTDGNLVKWGKMGASLHRSARDKAIGGKPPYLVPFFGMFGYGGPVAAMCLGRRAVVSSKTKKCKKVFTLHLEREALISASRLENCWRTKGGIRHPSDYGKEISRHQSFTMVEIFEPKMKFGSEKHFLWKLKDIYFPYIQFDEISGQTRRPVTFQVNGKDLIGIQGGEVATTNLHSCNGPDFFLQLHFSFKDPSSVHGQCKKVYPEANARLKFVYFPFTQGQENITKIIERLEADDYGIGESFETFSRVSIRRLGRLLPDARWPSIPFMLPKKKVGEKAKIMQRCCSRVKCFIDTDAGFNPTPHKTDFAHHHPYTNALKNFGSRAVENAREVQVEISVEGGQVTLPHLEKLYLDWISKMHDRYDEEIDGGLDEPIIVISPKIKKLGLSSDVLRVHKKIQRKGKCWTAGQKIKVLKGACAGVHKNHVYATLEYVILEGLQGDVSGEARLICRSLGVPEDMGCKLVKDKGNHSIDIRDSQAFPIRIIDSDMCIPVDDTEWENRFKAHCRKLPSAIELLSEVDCCGLDIDGGWIGGVIEASDSPPENIVAVVRPWAFVSVNSSKKFEQKFIFKDGNIDMVLEVKFMEGAKMANNLIGSSRVKPSSHKGLNGLYFFPLRSKFPDLFQKAGNYAFSFSLTEYKDVRLEKVLRIEASAGTGCWEVTSPKQDVPYEVRVGSVLDRLSIAWSDKYGNSVKFPRVPKLAVKVRSNDTILAHVRTMEGSLLDDKSTMIIKGIVIECDKLDEIRPNYEASLNISTLDETFSVAFPCRVLPGIPHRITVHPQNLRQLIPGQILEELELEVFDKYGNHAKKDERIFLSVDGFSYEDRSGVLDDGALCLKKVDREGIVDLSNILKVSEGYGKDVCLCVTYENKAIVKLNYRTVMRKLRTGSKVFRNCKAGSSLDNIVFEIVDSKGVVDESLNHDEKCGSSHTLAVKSDALGLDDSVQYTFRHGRCTIHSIPLPHRKGIFSFSAAHSRYPELNLDIEVHVDNGWHRNQGDATSDEDVGNSFSSAHNSSADFPCLPQTPISKALKSPHDLVSPLTFTGNTLPTSVIYSPKTLKENSVCACQSAKALNENAVPAKQFPKALEESTGCARQPPRTPKKNSVPASQSPKTSKENSVRACQSAKALNENAVPARQIPKALEESTGCTRQPPRTPKENSVPASQSPKTLKKSVVPASCSVKTLNEDAATPIHSPRTSKFEITGLHNNLSDISLGQVSNRQGQEDLGASGFSQKEPGADVLNYLNEMNDLGRKVKMLEDMLHLQRASNLQDHDKSKPYGKILVQEKIRSKSQSAAALICNLIEETYSGSRPQDILGVVALLGSVKTIELSRMLAQYLGDDLMRAVVCKTSAAAKCFETEHGQSISGGYYTICLEDISPINCEPSDNPQDILLLPLPTSPNGYPPNGFLGYAVNMIDIEPSFSQWRMTAGHGLREILFYRLFGNLQVYDKRLQMMNAQSCIKDGAVSLDGGIVRGNGLLSSGQWEPDVLFPVCTKQDFEVAKLQKEMDNIGRSLDIAKRKYFEAIDRYNP